MKCLIYILFTLTLLNCVTDTVCRVAQYATNAGTGARKVRHSSGVTSPIGDPTATALLQLQSDILANLGMSQPPNTSGDSISEFARLQALQQAGVLEDDIEEEHFMSKSSNIILIAKQLHTIGFGETIQFVVNAADRSNRMSEIKLYYHVNSANITMHTGSEDNKMLLRLSLLTSESDGSISSQLIENIGIHKHLVGWHSQVIPNSLIRHELLNRGNLTENVTLNFHLSCLNCEYQVFPRVMTKQNVPFLRMDGWRRIKRTTSSSCSSDGSCCKRELIVDFEALGWDWVVHPKRYTANYCAGSCATPTATQRQSMSSNSLVLNAMLENLRRGNSNSCCVSVASEEEFIPIIYTKASGEVASNRNTIRTIHQCRCS